MYRQIVLQAKSKYQEKSTNLLKDLFGLAIVLVYSSKRTSCIIN